MARKKKNLTYAQRLAEANALTGSSFSMFEKAASGLEVASAAQLVLADEMDDEIAALKSMRDKAEADALAAQSSADRIRSLIS
jgi:hypothetical protein